MLIERVCSDARTHKVGATRLIDLFFLAELLVIFNRTDSPHDGATFKIDFGQLYGTLCRIVTVDQATLLLYLLLHRNTRFYRHVMAQQNLNQLVRNCIYNYLLIRKRGFSSAIKIFRKNKAVGT